MPVIAFQVAPIIRLAKKIQQGVITCMLAGLLEVLQLVCSKNSLTKHSATPKKQLNK